MFWSDGIGGLRFAHPPYGPHVRCLPVCNGARHDRGSDPSGTHIHIEWAARDRDFDDFKATVAQDLEVVFGPNPYDE